MLTLLALISALSGSALPQGGQSIPASSESGCADVFAVQVLLSRRGFSPGVVDGTAGPNLARALAAFQSAHNLPVSSEPDCATWEALSGQTADAVTASYRITEDDARGPFVERIPRGLPEQAKLPSLGYRSIVEKLAEKFRTSPETLRRLNPHAKFAPNSDIQVPAVAPFDADAKPMPDAEAAGSSVVVTRDESALRVLRPDGTIIFFAPVTTGSEHDPLPPGDWAVTAVSWKPAFNYNPDLFWDAKPGDEKAKLKPGPNNPVGVVWIDVNIEHYGIHGTPEPQRVGHTESHGCVRLTNWDAARLAALVGPGTPVQFR